MTATYAFIGAGNMAKGIIGGMIAGGITPEKIITSTYSRASGERLIAEFGVQNTQNNNDCLVAEVVVLAVKPQILTQVLAGLDKQLLAEKLIISVIAGIPCHVYYQHIKPGLRLVRTMPNMPAKIGQGMTGMYAENCNENDKTTADILLQYTGKTLWVEQEVGIDYVNAISGSGPAYVYTFIHHLAEAGEQLGLSYQDALILTLQTLLGSTQLAIRENDGSAGSIKALIQQITSKGGTTFEAMQSFEKDGFDTVIKHAVECCYQRAVALGTQYQ